MVELLQRGLWLVGDPTGRGIRREASVGQRHRELGAGFVDGAAHDVVSLQQSFAPSVELLDLLARLLPARCEVAEHPLAHHLRLGHHLPATNAPGFHGRRCFLLRSIEVALGFIERGLSLSGTLLTDASGRLLCLGVSAIVLAACQGDDRLALGRRLGQSPIGLPHRVGARVRGFTGGIPDDPLGRGLSLGANLRGGLTSR